jgi:catechol 2,3-dioxygenase-like lactoylglutathione lyase family enzyme
MENLLPAAALGHFVMKVQDVERSYEFYASLGLRPFGTYPGMAIIELRGGTHLLLFKNDDPQSDALADSRLGQRSEFGLEKLDLMIAGHEKSDLAQYRADLIGKGHLPSEIAEGPLYGHHYFSMHDPDGTGITFYTSHCSDKPV